MFLNLINKLEEYSDKRVDDWPLTSLGAPFIINGIYLFVVLYAAPAFMKNRKPFHLKKYNVFYNIVQIFSCLTILYGNLFNGWIDGVYDLKCIDNDYSYHPRALRFTTLAWWNMMIKILDLTETVVFVLRKKHNQVSFLHIYHHITTYTLMFICVKYLSGIMCSVLIMINSFIHVLMYTYYLVSLLGPEVMAKIQKYKRILTILQMIQFVFIIAYSGQLYFPHCRHLPDTKNVIYLFLPHMFVIFYLFYDFFRKAYLNNNKNK